MDVYAIIINSSCNTRVAFYKEIQKKMSQMKILANFFNFERGRSRKFPSMTCVPKIKSIKHLYNNNICVKFRNNRMIGSLIIARQPKIGSRPLVT